MPLRLYRQFLFKIAILVCICIAIRIFLSEIAATAKWASILIEFTLITVGSTLLMHHKVGKYIAAMTFANKRSKKDKIIHLNQQKLPKNEIADLYLSHEQLLYEVEDHQKILGAKLRDAEHNLILAAKMTAIGETTSTIVHDLRNPLTSILGFTRILVEKLEQENQENLVLYAQKILKAGRHIETLVKRMSLFGRHSVTLNEGISLLQCIQDTVIIIESSIQQNKVNFAQTNISEDKQFWGSKELVIQILVNLCSNAIDAMSQSSHKFLSITVDEQQDKYVIEVTDSGGGIPEDLLTEIFKPFFTTKAEGNGTGLGLASCKDIAAILKTKIQAKNSAETKGAVFSFSLWKKSPEEQITSNHEAAENSSAA